MFSDIAETTIKDWETRIRVNGKYILFFKRSLLMIKGYFKWKEISKCPED